ncbi:MAG: hypothetical protein DMF89_08955 [Acidobacteria bacterium]|nr:MAG: hypothetical protein DMF89_08955 [Acidobacteriota bacterium]
MWVQLQRIMSEAANRIVKSVAEFVPGILALVAVLAASVILGVIARQVTMRALAGVEFDRRAQQWGLGKLGDWSSAKSASSFVGRTVQWVVLIVGILVALTALDAAIPSRFALSVFEYMPHVLSALIVLAVGSAAAQFFARAVLIGAVNMQIHSARILSFSVKWLVLIVATSMAVEQLQIGRQILTLAFGILFGGVVLTASLAVGLGAKDAVGRAIERQYDRAPQERDHLDHV